MRRTAGPSSGASTSAPATRRTSCSASASPRDSAAPKRDLASRVVRDVRRDRLDLRIGQLTLERRHPAAARRDLAGGGLLRRLQLMGVGPDVAGGPRCLRGGAPAAAGLREDRLAVGLGSAAARGGGRLAPAAVC